MCRHSLIGIALAVLCTGDIAAQPDKAKPNTDKAAKPLDASYLRDHAHTRGFQLGRPVRPMPTPDGKAVLFLRSGPRSTKMSLFEFDVASGKTRELLTPATVLKGAEEKLSPEEKAMRERMRLSAGGFATYQLSPDGKLILLPLAGKLYLYDRAKKDISELKTGTGAILDPKFSPDGLFIAYVRDHDVYAIDLHSNREMRVTDGGSAILAHGTAEFVAQEEMDRFTGYWWDPESKAIMYQETDAKGVEVWRVADPIHPNQQPTPFFYPRPGKANVKVRLAIAPLEGGDKTWLSWDSEKYPYLAGVHWSKYGPPLITVQTRDQKELVVLQADVKTGKTKALVTETDKAWVNLHQDVPRWLPGGFGYLWRSERAGGPQLEVRNLHGRVTKVLVPPQDGFQGITDMIVDDETPTIIYNASADPTRAGVYRMAIDSVCSPDPVKRGPGIYSAVFAKNLSIYVLTQRPLRGMPWTSVHSGDGKFLAELPSVAEEPGFTPRVELVTVGNPKERTYQAAVVLPRNFDPKKRYPVMVDVYGGPHHIHVVGMRGRWLLDQWYADQGFIVVALDGRGTPGRGRDWERAIHQRFGSLPLDDQVAGLELLAKKYPAMDLKRVGIDGWSFGGYLSALAVLRRPDVFRAGVAGAPVVDWLDYDTHYTERYLGIPPKDETAYKEASLLTYAKDLKRPLLILHGTADDNVYFRHSLKLVDALFRHGKDFEILPLSGLTHMASDPLVMERQHARIAGFLKKHLGEPE